MKRILLTLILLLFTASNFYGQPSRTTRMSNYDYNLLTRTKSKPWNPTEFVGSPFYNQQFKLGKVYFKDSLIIKGALLRYNVVKENIEIKASLDAKAETIQSKPGLSFDYGDEHFQMMFNPITGMKQYFRKVYDGTIYKVYLKPLKEFKEGQKAVTHLTRDILPTYLPRDTYYYQQGKSFVEIRTNRRGVRKIFPDHRNEIKDFIKENDFRFNEDTFEWELTQVIRFYEGIKSNGVGNGDIVK